MNWISKDIRIFLLLNRWEFFAQPFLGDFVKLTSKNLNKPRVFKQRKKNYIPTSSWVIVPILDRKKHAWHHSILLFWLCSWCKNRQSSNITIASCYHWVKNEDGAMWCHACQDSVLFSSRDPISFCQQRIDSLYSVCSMQNACTYKNSRRSSLRVHKAPLLKILRNSPFCTLAFITTLMS